MTIRTLLAGVGLLAGFIAPTLATQSVPLYSYYTDPPFAVGSDVSLTERLANWLSGRSAGRYAFVPTALPRKRLDQIVATPHWSGVVAWVNPRWMLDDDQQRFLWSRAFTFDTNLVVSHRDRPVDFRGSPSLNGLRVGGIVGRQYTDLKEAFDSGGARREDAMSETNNLSKLKLGRIDVTFVTAMSLKDHRRQMPDLDRWLYVAARPRGSFDRHLFTSRDQTELMAFLNQALSALAADEQWRGLLASGTP